MKNLLLKSSILVSLFVALCSCGGGKEKESRPLSVSENKIEAEVLGGTKTISLYAPGRWYASTTARDAASGKYWVTITPSSGEAGTHEVKLKFSTNNSSGTRDGKVTFKTSDTQEQVTIEVAQKWARIISLPCTEYTVGWSGATLPVSGLSSTGVKIEIPSDADWVEAQGTNALVVKPNQAFAQRFTNITFIDTPAAKEYKLLLIQEGMGDNATFLPLSELKIDDYKCPSDSFTEFSDFIYSVHPNSANALKTAKITFQGDGVEWITIGDSDEKIYSGNTISLAEFKAGANLLIRTHNSSIEKEGENILYITNLPIVEITTSDAIKDEPKVDCVFRMFDPQARTDDGENKNLKLFESLAGIEYRGAGAQRYQKKPYNFKLKDSAGQKKEAELLNIRNDNSWILDGMYLDIARMRNRVCFDIWNQFSKPYYVAEKPKAMSGTRGDYVEVFINGQYMGLFILSDRIDRKQYQIDQYASEASTGYIYKAKGWTAACTMKGYSTPSNDDYIWSSAQIEQEYPDADDGGKPNFNHMKEVIKFVSSSSKEDFSARFEEVFDINSVVDAFIYLNMIVADDNIGRNTFWVIRNISTAPKVMHGLWDLDGTLGRNWNRNPETPEQTYVDYLSGWVVGHGNNSSGTTFYFHERIIKENPANIHQKIYDRWQEIKDGALAPSNFNNIVDSYAQKQKSAGVIDREVARWKAIDVSEQSKWGYTGVYYGDLDGETSYMKDWWKKRHAKLNELINTLQHN